MNELSDNHVSLTSTPSFFGAYFNLARLNIFMISNYITEEFQVTNKLNDEENIAKSFLCEHDKNTDYSRITYNGLIRYMQRFLPILKIFDIENDKPSFRKVKIDDVNDIANNIKLLFNEINDFRDEYTHYFKYASTESSNGRKSIISVELEDIIIRAYQFALENIKHRFRGRFSDSDFEIATLREKELFDYNKVVPYGIIFLICLFLDKKDAIEFLGSIKGFKSTENNKYIVVREVFTAFSINLPHPKFSNEKSNDLLMLDILNTLSKCPKFIYDSLNNEDKKRYQTTTDDTPSLDVRYDSRFCNFALQYLDSYDVLSNTNEQFLFQLSIGEVELKRYDKVVNNKIYKRSINENLICFAKLPLVSGLSAPEFENIFSKSNVYNDYKAEKDNTVYLNHAKFSPKYNIINNKIVMIKVPKDKSNDIVFVNAKDSYQFITLSVHELVKIIFVANHIGYLGVYNQINGFLQHLNNFYQNYTDYKLDKNGLIRIITNTKTPAELSNKYVKEIKNRKKEFDEKIKDINSKQIPTSILDSLLNISYNKLSFSNFIKQKFKESSYRLKKLKNDVDLKIKNGEIASFLANDMVKMMIDKDKKQLVTSFIVSRMQECFAYIHQPEKQSELKLLMEKYIIPSHPFIKEYSFQMNIRDIYKIYLSDKVSWLRKTFYSEITKNGFKFTKIVMPEDTTNIPYIFCLKDDTTKAKIRGQLAEKNISNDAKIKTKIANHYSKFIELPTNLFDKIIDSKLSKAKHINLITSDYQEYYNLEREITYKDFGFVINPNGNVDDNKAFKRRYEKFIKDVFIRVKKDSKIKESQLRKNIKEAIFSFEKDIRICKEEDIAMMYILKNMDKDRFQHLTLSNINDYLNAKFMMVINKKNNKSIPKNKQLIINSNPKNYKRFYKVIFDKRINDLLMYFHEKDIDIDKVFKELDIYNKSRVEIFKKIFELENAVLKYISYDVKKLHKGDYSNIQHKPYLDFLKDNSLINNAEYTFIEEIRNKFSHNQFPTKDTAEKYILLTETKERFAEVLKNEYCKKVDEIIKKLN